MRDSRPNPRQQITFDVQIATGLLKPLRSGVISISNGTLTLAGRDGTIASAPTAEVHCKGVATTRLTVAGSRYYVRFAPGGLSAVKSTPPLFLGDVKSVYRLLRDLIEQAQRHAAQSGSGPADDTVKPRTGGLRRVGDLRTQPGKSRRSDLG
ncbi:hypothetical protein [Streptacidiphilus carbonis]|jgi:hypothetical protein|uniref:hypothetical protein n=1 Tax=Streptacidiphilus carbonis TaxID=105422 RepID=UPI0005A84519|nr:hypothetical protein [Streptacidiphilus carbonis]